MSWWTLKSNLWYIFSIYFFMIWKFSAWFNIYCLISVIHYEKEFCYLNCRFFFFFCLTPLKSYLVFSLFCLDRVYIFSDAFLLFHFLLKSWVFVLCSTFLVYSFCDVENPLERILSLVWEERLLDRQPRKSKQPLWIDLFLCSLQQLIRDQ